ncbi:hypothetical protein M5W70_13460 [Paenibacillus larvae]|uniref:Uncharacterized protein n=1 Tax=Paenibacillus larvae TaxID=1464 RepID=A0AAP5JTZ8_9BACL|nr:hypothetical protein [Paenibacillus larvae]MCY9689686.1 hypothetical protein [Paenibacillus larvae]MCY9750934.1 hypothetical protein [Paenibacillus larvae]MDT2252009.1 hypothetical protein [Paenibacillus larvae]MDV3486529.1 hypothetical protein [Paenibacillus larvae]MEC0187150.1 hypothetical protein [Paenibacillus larvae]
MNIVYVSLSIIRLLDYLHEAAPKAFILSYEPRNFKGGFWTKRLKS